MDAMTYVPPPITTITQARAHVAQLIAIGVEVGGLSHAEAVAAADRAVESARHRPGRAAYTDEDDFAFGMIRCAMNEALPDDEEA